MEQTNQTNEDLKKSTGWLSTESFKPKPPMKIWGKIPEGTILCLKCGLPGGKITLVDQNGRVWKINVNTNLIKTSEGMIHQNPKICESSQP
jgi:hypothetical protein